MAFPFAAGLDASPFVAIERYNNYSPDAIPESARLDGPASSLHYS
jgi:hypothetical protein